MRLRSYFIESVLEQLLFRACL